MQNFIFSFLLTGIFCCAISTIGCAQPPDHVSAKDDPLPIRPNFLDSISRRIITNAESIKAYTFEQNNRGETQLASTSNAVHGYKVLKRIDPLTGGRADTVRQSLLQQNLYDTSGYLPRCGFDPDLGFTFIKGGQKLTVLLMTKTNCNVVQFFRGDSLISVKALTNPNGRKEFVSIAKRLFPAEFSSTPLLLPRIDYQEPTLTPATQTSTQIGTVTASYPPPATNTTKYYTVKKKDSLMKIARKSKVNSERIKLLNPQITNWGVIHPEDKIRISE